VWWFSGAAVSLAWAQLVLVWTGLTCGLGLWLSLGQAQWFGQTVQACAQYAPAVAVVIAVCLLLAALRPGLVVLGWIVPGFALVVIMLGNTLDLPGWARHLSPLEWIGRLPVDDPSVAVSAVMVVLAAAVAAASGLAFGRRNLVAG
jgi:ABC-2 type transport system permease protein